MKNKTMKKVMIKKKKKTKNNSEWEEWNIRGSTSQDAAGFWLITIFIFNFWRKQLNFESLVSICVSIGYTIQSFWFWRKRTF